MKKSMVSIITVCFNAESTIEQTIESVLSQTYSAIEYIIIDGASTDHTMDVVNKYIDKIHIVISEKDTGIYNAMNKGLDMAHGEIIGILNADDWYEPDAVERAINLFEKNQQADIVAGQINVIADEKILYATRKKQMEVIWYQMPFPHPSCFVKKSVYDRIGNFDESYRLVADYEFLLRAYDNGVNFNVTGDVYANFRQNGASSDDRMLMEETKRAAFSHLGACPCKKKVMEYFKRQTQILRFQELLEAEDECVCEVIKQQLGELEDGISIFGTGLWGNKLRHYFEQKNIKIRHVYDNDEKRTGQLFGKNRIISGKSLKQERDTVIVAVIDHEAEIENQLIEYHNKELKFITCTQLIHKLFADEKPLLSVIVPIYNKELYLEEALKSLQRQTLREIEIICVDDGSTDASGSIADRFAKGDSRFSVLHQENTGQVGARKNGLKLATADYVGFMDADDWIEPDMYESMYREMEENKLDFLSTGIIERGRERFDGVPAGVYENEQDKKKIFLEMLWDAQKNSAGIIGNAVTKLYKRELLIETSSGIDAKIHYREDDCFVYSYLLKCKKIGVMRKAFYHYRYVEDSDSLREDELFFARANYFYLFLKKEFSKSEYADILLQQLDEYFVRTLQEGINNRGGVGITAAVDYRFPLKGKSKIVVYGNGEHGKELIKKLKKDKQYKVLAVLDKNWQKMQEECTVYPMEYVKELDFDILIVSIMNERIQCEVIEELKKLGVDREKIAVI